MTLRVDVSVSQDQGWAAKVEVVDKPDVVSTTVVLQPGQTQYFYLSDSRGLKVSEVPKG